MQEGRRYKIPFNNLASEESLLNSGKQNSFDLPDVNIIEFVKEKNSVVTISEFGHIGTEKYMTE